MNPDIKAQWIEALRSGNYKQHRDSIIDKERNRFCCIGVYADVIAPDGWDKNDPTYENADFGNVFDHFSDEQYDELVKMNDELLYDFNQIADWIEENL